MNEIKEYYQPLYEASEKYLSLNSEIGQVKRCIDFLNYYIDNKEETDLEKKDLKGALLEMEQDEKEALRLIISKNLLYFGGVGITYPVLILLGVAFPIGGIAVHIIIHAIFLSLINGGIIPDFIKKRRAVKKARKCRKYLKKQIRENVNELLLALHGKLNELRDEKSHIREYLSMADKQFLSVNNELANKILEDHGIDAEISIETGKTNLKEKLMKKKKLK